MEKILVRKKKVCAEIRDSEKAYDKVNWKKNLVVCMEDHGMLMMAFLMEEEFMG